MMLSGGCWYASPTLQRELMFPTITRLNTTLPRWKAEIVVVTSRSLDRIDQRNQFQGDPLTLSFHECFFLRSIDRNTTMKNSEFQMEFVVSRLWISIQRFLFL